MSGSPAAAGPVQVQALLDRLDHPLKAGVLTLRAATLAADPGITELVKWNAPSFRFAGRDRLTFRLAAALPIQLVLHRGAAVRADRDGFTVADPAGLIRWLAADRGIVEFTDLAQVENCVRSGAFTDLVVRWVHS